MKEFEITAADIIASQAEEIKSLKIAISEMHTESHTQISDLNSILGGKNDFIADLQHIQQITDLEVQALNAEVLIMHKKIRKLQSSNDKQYMGLNQ